MAAPGPDQRAAARLLRRRPFDVVGAALGAPMIVWGLLDWFGAAGDSGGGIPGFFSGNGATAIVAVLAASSLALNQVLAGRTHNAATPPIACLISASAAIVVLGGMIAKPDGVTLLPGALAGLLTATTQAVLLLLGWLTGSRKAVQAAHVRSMHAQQAAADELARRAEAARQRPGPNRPGDNPPGYPAAYPPGYPAAYPPGYPAAYPPGYPAAYPPGYPGAYPPSYPASAPPGYPASAPPGYPGAYPPGHPGTPPPPPPGRYPRDM